MRILDYNEKAGTVKLKIETIDDLWYLENIIEDGDVVYGVTYRREEEKTDMVRSKKMERIRIWVGIKVESTEFQEYSDRFRVHGTIVEGPEEFLGLYHSLNIELDVETVIKKDAWNRYQIEELKKSELASKVPLLLFVSMDSDEATIAMMREYGVQEIAKVSIEKEGKDYEVKEAKNRLGEIYSKLKQYMKKDMPVLIIGPGFAKEQFFEYLKEKGEVMQNVILGSTSYPGMRGIYESLKSGSLESILSSYRMKKESDLVEMLMTEIKKEGLYSYGYEETKNKIEMGAVKILLVTNKLFKTKEIQELMNMVQQQRGEVHIISTAHESGKMLQALGGIGAILRFK